MPRGYPSVTADVKDLIINRIKENGEKVADIAKEYGLNPKLIYGWLANRNNGSSEILELSKLRRERQALLAIIGELTVANKLSIKKN